MPKKESIQEKISHQRVKLTYQVQVGEAIEKKELPFVAGVLGNFSGDTEASAKLRDRKFVNVDKENFNDVMKAMGPSLRLQVDNKLQDNDSKLALDLKFKHIDDFTPDALVTQVEPLRKLLEVRQKLADLRNKAASNLKFEDLLNEVLANTDKIAQLSREVGGPGPEPK